MIQLHIDGTIFSVNPENAENVRALCASIKTKGKGRKFKARKAQLDMTRRYPQYAVSTYDYVCQYESDNGRIFGQSEMTRWAPLNTARTTEYDATMPICEEFTE